MRPQPVSILENRKSQLSTLNSFSFCLDTGGRYTNYLWDELSQYGDVVLESDATTGATKTGYVLAQGELLAQSRYSGTPSLDYMFKDGQGSTRALVDGSGTLVTSGGANQQYNYNAFGQLQSQPSTLAASYLYTGQQFDSATGLYDLRARYYSPGDGRFLSQDKWSVNTNNPIELNRYNYTANNPVSFKDPTGNNLDVATIVKTFIAAYAVGSALAFVGEILFWYITLAVWTGQTTALLSKADNVVCTTPSGKTYNGYADCTYYLGHQVTVEFGNLINSWAEALSSPGPWLWIATLVTAVFPSTAAFAYLLGALAFIAGNNVARLKDMSFDIKLIAASNNNQGRIWVFLSKNNTSNGIKYGSW